MQRSRLTIACCVAIAAVAVVGLLVVPAGAGVASTKSAPLTIKDFGFHPRSLNAKVGDTIKVSNKDDTTHTVRALNDAFNTGDISGGDTASFKVTRPGNFKFHCNIHNYMKGTIKVRK